MAWKDRYTRPGPGIPKDAPKKKGLALFFDILWREAFELIKLNLLFLLFCIPIITIPAALTAMSRVTVKMVRDENHFLWTDFFETFKKEFLPATAGGGCFILVLLLSFLGILLYGNASTQNSLFTVPMAVCLIMFVVTLMSSFYYFPIQALVDLPLGSAIKNSFLLSFLCMKYNLIVLFLVCIIVFFLAVYIFLTIPLILLLACSLLNFICTFAAYSGIRKYIIQDESAPES